LLMIFAKWQVVYMYTAGQKFKTTFIKVGKLKKIQQ
jgi:hypothetical protein